MTEYNLNANNVYDESGENGICSIYGLYLHTDLKSMMAFAAENKNVAEALANALLIAAAPDLLQELQNIANADYRHWEDGHNTAEEFVLWAKSRARHAIAKAEGVKP